MGFRLTPSRVEIGYIALSVIAIAAFAIPLWYAWKVNIGTLRVYVDDAQVRNLARALDSAGERGLVDATEALAGELPGDEIVLLADAAGRRLAGNLPAWPAEIPSMPGTYGLVLGLGNGVSMRVVATHVGLPGGYRLLVGRESARFQSLEQVFQVGVVTAVAVVLLLGVATLWLIRRVIFSEVDRISRTAMEIAAGDYSRRVPAHEGSGELEVLGRAVNGMLDQLATQNSRLEKEIAERDGAERALQQAHGALESLVSQRTAELARVNESLAHALRETEQQKAYLDELFDLAPDAIVLTGFTEPRTLRINREFTRMFGYTGEEALGRRLRTLIVPAEARRLTEDPDFVAGKTVELESIRQRKDGTRFHAHMTAKRVRLRGGDDTALIIYRDITQRKRAEEELLRQKAHLDELFDLAPDAIVLTTIRSPRNIRVNKEFTRMFGYTAEEAVGRRMRDLIAPPEVQPANLTENPDLLAGRTVEKEAVRQRKDGSRFHAHITAKRVSLSDAEDAAYVIYRDISERKRAEIALMESEARFRSLTALSSDFFWETDAEDRYTSIEFGTGYRGFGSSVSKLGRTRWEIPSVSPDEAAWIAHRAAIAARQTFVGFCVSRIEGGAERFYEFSGEPRFDGRGRFLGYRGIGHDLTERKHAEKALRLSEERYARALEATDEGHFEWNVVTDDLFVSPRARELLGYAGDRTGRPDFAASAPYDPDDSGALRMAMLGGVSLTLYHPEDRARVRNSIVEALAGTAQRLDIEFRIVLAPGQVRWLHVRWKIARNDAGAALLVTGVLTDISGMKADQEALRLSEERYARAIEATEAGHWEWDLRTNEVYHSLRFRELHGIPAEEQFAHRDQWKARQNYLPGERERQDRAIRGAIEGPEHRYEIDVRIAPRPGEVRWLRSRGKLFRDQEGRPALMAGTSIDVTAYKLAEEALRLSEERYARAMEASEDGVWEWNLATDHIYVSPRARQLFGVPDGAEIRNRADLVAHGGFHPDDRGRIEETIAECLAGCGDFEVEYRVVGSTGATKWIRSRGKVFRDAEGRPSLLTGSLTDFTRRRAAEEELSRQRVYLDQLFELAPIAIILNSVEPRTLRVNREFTRMFGYAAEEVVGRHIRDLIVPRGAGAITEDPRFRSGERIEEDVLRKRKDGSLFHAHVIAAHIPLPDSDDAAYVIYHDITERKRAEETLRLSERKRRQTQRMEAMGTLAGGIAHDFNNILGAILGYGEMALRDAPDGSRLRRDLNSILTAGERGRALVDRVLSFSRSGVGERFPVHVEKVVREALAMLQPAAPEGIRIEARLEAGRAAMLGEPTQVHQVVTNLATNAIQAMPAGGTLLVSLRTQSFDAERAATIGTVAAGDYILLQVVDSGTGIAPEILDRIFDPFFTTKEVNVGNGLGLSIVHGIVAELGGAIDVASTAGAGSTFTIYLPRTGDAPDAGPDDAGYQLARGNGERVMVVDDEEPLVGLTLERLRDLGYEPTGFTSSAAAFEAFRADPDGYDAVITDERMPGMSGAMLIREVRRVRQAVPILLVSGYVGGMVTSRAYNEGADEVLKKPLSMRDLAASLARIFRQ